MVEAAGIVTVIGINIGIGIIFIICSGSRIAWRIEGGATFEEVHAAEEGPGRGGGAMAVGAVALSKLFDFVAALGGSLGGWIAAGAGSNRSGNFFPLVGLELATVEGVPFLLVGIDEVDGLLVGPRGRDRGSGGNSRGRREEQFWGVLGKGRKRR